MAVRIVIAQLHDDERTLGFMVRHEVDCRCVIIQTLMTTSRETKRKIAIPTDRVRLLISQLWMTAVLLGFLIIRVLESNTAHRLSSWWRAH